MTAAVTLTERQITDTANGVDLGQPHAVKRGRNPQYPYVPVIVRDGHTEQVLNRAFRTSDAAFDCAEKTIAVRRAHLAARLANPRMRALREQHGLPREITEENQHG